jgi:hypothetical protein
MSIKPGARRTLKLILSQIQGEDRSPISQMLFSQGRQLVDSYIDNTSEDEIRDTLRTVANLCSAVLSDSANQDGARDSRREDRLGEVDSGTPVNPLLPGPALFNRGFKG